MRFEDEWEEEDFENLADLVLEEELEEEFVTPSKVYTLTDMEKHGEAGAAAVEALLEADPDVPTSVLLEELRKHVKPLSYYRPTEEELLAIRRADIMHTLRGEKDGVEDEEENN